MRQATDDDIRAVLLEKEVDATKTRNRVAPSATEYIRPAGVAVLVRAALKKRFPGTKFRVRSGSHSVTVTWIDGPLEAQVEEVADAYDGYRADGMVDYGYHVEHFLMPDGTATLAQSSGSAYCGGVDPAFKAFKPHPDARRVTFCASVDCYRSHSADAIRHALAAVAARWGGFDPDDLQIITDPDGGAFCDGAQKIRLPPDGAFLHTLLRQELEPGSATVQAADDHGGAA
jgi:hypothetical protein